MDSIPRQLLLQVVLILINAFFAATEIAVISLNGTKLEKQIEEGDKTARKLLKLVTGTYSHSIQIRRKLDRTHSH